MISLSRTSESEAHKFLGEFLVIHFQQLRQDHRIHRLHSIRPRIVRLAKVSMEAIALDQSNENIECILGRRR
jgi:hypothetical protein